MNTEPNPDYTKPELLARFLRSFDNVVKGKYLAQAMGEQFRRVHTEQQMEAMKQMADLEEPTIAYVLREKQPHRRLNPFSMFRYLRDNIRLRKYNREWLKNNIH